jgi:pimeloyl-ACP methyl ester carboxylesterase
MKLFTREWGTGDRLAVLVHGVMSDSRTWHRVAPALVDAGYRVIAVDQAGHGQSPRAKRYSPEQFADDLIETVPRRPEILLGHSLGGLTASLAVDRILPDRAIYIDPGFSAPALTWWQRMLLPLPLRSFTKQSTAEISARNPRWAPDDVRIEAETLAAFDQRVLMDLTRNHSAGFRAPTSVEVPSLAVLADPSRLVPPPVREHLEDEGFEIRVVHGAGHSIDRDDFDGYMKALDGWI